MKKPEKFLKKVLDKSEAQTPSVLQSEWIITSENRLIENSKCICGQKLLVDWDAYEIYNTKTHKYLYPVGSCCIKKLNPRSWNSKKIFLYNAYDMARNDTERSFVQSLINRLTKYGSDLIVSRKQANWLENITRQEWRWKVWKEKKNKAS